jgi:serine/threonine-protein kinase
VIKVLDFGIAKLAVARGATLTRTGAALGTPLYMSLEQLRGDKDIDQRADVYAFGVMLYEAVTGLMPYEAETLPELAIKVATTDAPPVKSLRPDVPTALARIIDWAVARDRNQRLPDLQTLQRELEIFAHDRSFRDQMTKRDAPMPRLAAEKSDETAATTPANRVPPRAAAAAPEAKPMLRPEADTFRAKEVARKSSSAKAGWLSSRWVLGGAGLAGVLVAGSVWFQSSATQQTETNAAVAAPAPAAKPEPPAAAPVQPKPLSAPGDAREPEEALEPIAKQIEPAATKPSEPPAVEVEIPPAAEKPAPKPAAPAVTEAPPKLRAQTPPPMAAKPSAVVAAEKPRTQTSPPPAAKPQPVIVVEKTPPPAPAAPAKKTPRELVGF